MGIYIRQCRKTDENSIINICYRTGFMGEDLTGTGRFNDKKLFGYLFCIYYARYETENSFVAADNDSVVGYILGTMDSKNQEKMQILRMGWRIILRMLFYTSWKYPESFKTVLYFLKHASYDIFQDKIYSEYPSHLHINVLPEYQHSGIGSMLIDRFEEHIKYKGISGIHLRTSSYNEKAVPFYIKKGYKIIIKRKEELWSNVKDYQSIVFAKKSSVIKIL